MLRIVQLLSVLSAVILLVFLVGLVFATQFLYGDVANHVGIYIPYAILLAVLTTLFSIVLFGLKKEKRDYAKRLLLYSLMLLILSLVDWGLVNIIVTPLAVDLTEDIAPPPDF